MFYGRVYALSTLAVAALALPARGQSVVSTRSGVVHFFEGDVYLADQPLEARLGKFPCMAQGAELRTAQGRAEVLLTPGVILRVGERSAIRMIANDLTDTRIELLTGSAIVDADQPGSETSVTLTYRDWKVRFLEKGVYRIDSQPPRLFVRQGAAKVSAGADAPVSVEHGMGLPLAAVLVPERSFDEPADALSNWAKGRGESISADNAIASHISDDPASMGNSGLTADGFTYFPMIGLSPLGPNAPGVYSSYTPYQPGFSSIYLPGYNYRPLFLGMALRGYRAPLYTPLYAAPGRTGFAPGAGAGPGVYSPGARYPAPAPHPPSTPPAGHPVTRGGFHGGHR